MTRQVHWLNAINQVKDAMARVSEIHLHDLNALTEEEFGWFLAIVHKDAYTIEQTAKALSHTVSSRQPVDDGVRD